MSADNNKREKKKKRRRTSLSIGILTFCISGRPLSRSRLSFLFPLIGLLFPSTSSQVNITATASSCIANSRLLLGRGALQSVFCYSNKFLPFIILHTTLLLQVQLYRYRCTMFYSIKQTHRCSFIFKNTMFIKYMQRESCL